VLQQQSAQPALRHLPPRPPGVESKFEDGRLTLSTREPAAVALLGMCPDFGYCAGTKGVSRGQLGALLGSWGWWCNEWPRSW
jgi:hypothetical protein